MGFAYFGRGGLTELVRCRIANPSPLKSDIGSNPIPSAFEKEDHNEKKS